jgi:glycosyltransferase involved in cell wall biosynthesis
MRRLVDRVIAIDESVRLSIREIPSRVVYNPAVSRRTRAEAPRPREPSGSVRVSFLAGLEDYKGLWDLLGAARLLRERRDVVFQIFGRNRWPQDFYRSPAGRLAEIAGLFRDIAGEAEAFIRREGLEGTVRLMGVAPPEEALARTDVVVFPSRLNGVGRSVFEAGLLGIPGIVTLRDRVEDIVEHGVTGLIAPEADPPALAAAIRTLADDPALRARMGEAAREKYARQFDGPRIAEEVLAIYREVLARTGPRA